MADKNVDALENLFHEKAEFFHMGGSWGTERKLYVIEGGGIWYKQPEFDLKIRCLESPLKKGETGGCLSKYRKI